MNNFRHIYIHHTRPNSDQRVSESSSLDDHIRENEDGCLGEGLRGKSSLRLFWIQFFYILCGIISEHLIALPGQLWTNTITSALQIWNLWCPLIRNNWQKLTEVKMGCFFPGLVWNSFPLVRLHQNTIANLWVLSAAWHWNAVVGTGLEDMRWGEGGGISGFIQGQGLESINALCFGKRNSEGKRGYHKFIPPGVMQKLLLRLVFVVGK